MPSRRPGGTAKRTSLTPRGPPGYDSRTPPDDICPRGMAVPRGGTAGIVEPGCGGGIMARDGKRKKGGKPLRELIRQAENKVAGKPVEHAIAYDAAGNEVLRKEGSVEKVTLTKAEQAALQRTTVVHNHPSEHTGFGAVVRDIPPSEDDLSILLRCQVREVRVITESYRYILRANPDPRHPTPGRRFRFVRQQWEREYGKIWRKRYNRLTWKHGDPLPLHIHIDFFERISDDAHKAWGIVARRCHLHYRREARS